MLIDDIIDMLADDTRPLGGALLKIKVLLHKLGAPELTAWVNLELNGYADGVEVPSYRALPGTLKGNIANAAVRYSNHPLPYLHIEAKKRDFFKTARMGQPIATLENLVSSGSGTTLARLVPMEFNPELGKALDPSFIVEQAWVEVGKSDVVGVLSQVRSRLLDFLLELRGKAGAHASEQQMEEVAKGLNLKEMFNGAVFGDNTTVLLGTGNVQQVSAQVLKGDAASLKSAMKKAGLKQAEINELVAAIAADHASDEKAMDGKVGHWYFDLLKKAAKGAASVGTDIVTGAIHKLLAQYLGLPGA